MRGKIVDYLRREPVAFQGVVQASLAMLVGFGLISWTAEQTALAMGFCAAILGFLARSQVSPTAATPARPASTGTHPVTDPTPNAGTNPDEAARIA
jgi:hypothetical protein